MKELRDLVIDNVQPRKRGNQLMNGHSKNSVKPSMKQLNYSVLAMLLKTLVRGANAGKFPSVPNAWEGFILLATDEAKTQALEYLRNQISTKFDNVQKPFPMLSFFNPFF